jgi:hypothetical protein
MNEPRYFDGLVREVKSVRHAGDRGSLIRVELLECGHEQVFYGKTLIRKDGMRQGKGIGRNVIQSRVCRTCQPSRYGHS